MWCCREWKAAAGFSVSCKLLAIPPADVPIGAEADLASQTTTTATDADVSIDAEVLHVYATGLHEGLLHDVPADNIAATVHLSGVCGPSLSQMFADYDSKESDWHKVPRAADHPRGVWSCSHYALDQVCSAVCTLLHILPSQALSGPLFQPCLLSICSRSYCTCRTCRADGLANT